VLPLRWWQQFAEAGALVARCITRCITRWISLWITLWIERWNLGGWGSLPQVVTRYMDSQEDGELSPVSRETFTGVAFCRIFLPKWRKITESSHFRGQSHLSQTQIQQPSQSPQFVTLPTLVSWRVGAVDMARITEPATHRQVWINLWISSVENWGQNPNRTTM